MGDGPCDKSQQSRLKTTTTMWGAGVWLILTEPSSSKLSIILVQFSLLLHCEVSQVQSSIVVIALNFSICQECFRKPQKCRIPSSQRWSVGPLVPQQINIRWSCKFEVIDLLSEKLPLFVSTMMNIAENSLKCHDSKQSCQPSKMPDINSKNENDFSFHY